MRYLCKGLWRGSDARGPEGESVEGPLPRAVSPGELRLVGILGSTASVGMSPGRGVRGEGLVGERRLKPDG